MIMLVLGRRELGKTTLARYLAHARSSRLILDPRAQWIASDPYEHIDGDADAILSDLADERDVVIQPDDLQATVDQAAGLVRAFYRERPMAPLAVVLDEAGLYNVRRWDWVFRCSPRGRTSIILTAHRPADISTDVRALADTWCLFRSTQEHDLAVIEERCGEEVRRLVEALPPFHFVEWDDARATYRVFRDPAAWFSPSAAPLVGETPRSTRLF